MPQSNLIDKSTLINTHGHKSWEGFLWYDDSKAPELFNGEQLDFKRKLSSLPFVVEGMLMDTEGIVSLTIIHTDAGYHVLESTGFAEGESEVKYLAADPFGIEKLKLVFLPYFERVPDVISNLGFMGDDSSNSEAADGSGEDTKNPSFHEQRFSHFIFMGFEDAGKQEDEPIKTEPHAS